MRQTFGGRDLSHARNDIAEALSQQLSLTFGEFRRRSRRDEGVDGQHGGEDERRRTSLRFAHLQRVYRLDQDSEKNGEVKISRVTRAHTQWEKDEREAIDVLLIKTSIITSNCMTTVVAMANTSSYLSLQSDKELRTAISIGAGIIEMISRVMGEDKKDELIAELKKMHDSFTRGASSTAASKDMMKKARKMAEIAIENHSISRRI